MPAKRVFILGSGFSASMGLPTLVNLFDRIMARPERPGEIDKENVKAAFDFLYPHYTSYPPYEEFLSLMTFAQDFAFFSDKHFWKKKITSSLRLLIDYLAEKSSEAEDSELLISFCRNLEYGDVIITFNWDNLVERCLFSLGLNVNFEKRNTNAITVLKLHGSINMGLVPEGAELKKPESVVWLERDRVFRTEDYSYNDPWDALDIPPFIVPPVSLKRPAADEFLGKLWYEAFNSLMQGEQRTFVGYSLPDDDLQARALFKSAKEREYVVLDPNIEVKEKYRSEISPRLIFIQDKFSMGTLPKLFQP